MARALGVGIAPIAGGGMRKPAVGSLPGKKTKNVVNINASAF